VPTCRQSSSAFFSRGNDDVSRSAVTLCDSPPKATLIKRLVSSNAIRDKHFKHLRLRYQFKKWLKLDRLATYKRNLVKATSVVCVVVCVCERVGNSNSPHLKANLPLIVHKSPIRAKKINHKSDKSIGEVLCLGQWHFPILRGRFAKATAQLSPKGVVRFHLLSKRSTISSCQVSISGGFNSGSTLHFELTTDNSGSRRAGGTRLISSWICCGAISLLLSMSIRMTSSIASDIFFNAATLERRMPDGSAEAEYNS